MVAKGQDKAVGRPGRRPLLNAEHTQMLRAITQEQPRSSLDEVTRELFRRAGVLVSTVTVRKAGIERMKPLRRTGERAVVQGQAPARYGYTGAHRRSDGASGMNTDLTDAEWALVGDLFEREGRRLLLRAAHGLCVAPVAQDIRALAGGLQVLQPLGSGGPVRRDARPTATAVA